MKHLSIIAILLLVYACSTREKLPLAGKWEATDKHDGQTDSYVLTIKVKSHDIITGLIESKMDGDKLPGVPIDSIVFEYPNFTFYINSDDLKITYSGKISADNSQLQGHFEYSNPKLAAKELTFIRKTPLKPQKQGYRYAKPISNVFPTTSLMEARLNKKIIDELLQNTAHGDFGEINSLLVVKDNKLVIEAYFNGAEADQLHQLQSCTKSVTSLLVGIALDHNYLQSVDDKVLSYFPESEYALGWENITIRHLLTMSSGVEWIKEDPKSPWDKDEGIAGILKKPIVGKTGTDFDYNSAMQVLGGILERATGMKLENFARQYLFHPLEITDYEWGVSNVDSVPLCTGALRLRPLDMAKIGVMVLQKGVFKKKHIVSEAWINESTSVQLKVPNNRGDHYGYLWWIGTQSEKIEYAHGMGSQFIFIVPHLNLVVVTTGNNLFNNKDTSPFEMLKHYILKSIQDE